jgi:hypothetical protein
MDPRMKGSQERMATTVILRQGRGRRDGHQGFAR